MSMHMNILVSAIVTTSEVECNVNVDLYSAIT